MPEKSTFDHLDNAASIILSLQHKMPDGVVLDADTVLADILDNMETEVTGSGFELIQLYLSSCDKAGFCRMFEVITGTTWNSYLDETLRVMTKYAQPEEILLTDCQHDGTFRLAGNLRATEVPYEHKNVNELKPKRNFEIPGDIE